MPKYFYFFVLLFVVIACHSTNKKKQTKPNVILILTDDQGYGDVGIHGNDSIQTPVQDLLAREGIRMDNFYVSPVCAPTRASLLTGRYHYRTGTTWVTRNAESMRSEEVTLAEVFKANGYGTGCFGKWHNGAHYPENPNGQGFDTFTGFCGGHWNRYIDPTLEVNGEKIATKGYIADIFTDSAMAFITRQVLQEKPSFTYIPYNTPHTPFIAPPKLFEKYKEQGLTDRIASTYGMIENIDDNIGRLLQHLEQANILENTLVIFMTDNGPNFDRYNANMKGRKGSINDGGVRVPCFFYWKGTLKGGQISKQLTSHIDILPTLVDLLDLKKIETLPLDGISFAKLLRGEVDTLPHRLVHTFSINQDKYKGAVRTQDFRLTFSGKRKPQLTKLLEDPGERKELSEYIYGSLFKTMQEIYRLDYEDVTREVSYYHTIPVGYSESPIVELPAHEGFPIGEVKYKTAHWGWCNDWFTNWTTSRDTMQWKLEVQSAGTYKISIEYACSENSVRHPISVKCGTHIVGNTFKKAFESKYVEDYEQVPREVEADEKTWVIQEIGKISLQKGLQNIELFSNKNSTTKDQIAEVKSLILQYTD